MKKINRRSALLYGLLTPVLAAAVDLPGFASENKVPAMDVNTKSAVQNGAEKTTAMVELRVYHCVPGRMPELHQRFINTALGFFKKYGIRPIGFWTNITGTTNQSLTYLLHWESMAEREAKWNAFEADAQWIAKHAESEAQGPLIERIENHFMEPTSYSALQ
jgi:hypothetical protein